MIYVLEFYLVNFLVAVFWIKLKASKILQFYTKIRLNILLFSLPLYYTITIFSNNNLNT